MGSRMSASSLTLAKFHGGVCQGSLVKAVEAGAGITVSSGFLISSSAPVKVPEYCLLAGVRLTCYESWLCMNSGHAPTAIYSVVGASAASNSTDASFRVVTNQGTRLLFDAPSTRCRDIWLKSLNAGLERYFASSDIETVLEPVKPRYRTENMRNPPKHCGSCGKLERHEFPLVHNARPLSQYGMETRMNLCSSCEVAQGMVEHVQWMQELFSASKLEQEMLTKARVAILKALIPDLKTEDISTTQPTTRIELSSLSHHQLSVALSSEECIKYCSSSPTLDRLKKELEEGLVGCMELVEIIEHSIGIKDQSMAKLKQQALRFNGDMGTALRMLATHALPNPLHQADEDKTIDQKSTELLQCILEFFMDLIDEGELQSIAFFWPQLLNIHLQMLPASDAISLGRVELMEDFLLTVATNYSVHLAIELIWSHTAELEDARSLSYCAKRRSAVLRFLCELESLLFDFEMGWGGGSVTVGQILGPSEHQISILRSGMRDIQTYRLSSPEKLSRSQRERKLRREEESRDKGEVLSVPPQQQASDALRIAKNADYISTHMAFTKRLGDIAYRLFYQPVEKRKQILEAELSKLNSSGSMGGDPLNRVKERNDHTRVVRIPTKEGHVFRSKERTPVLLLVETIDEGAEYEIDKKELTPFPKAQPTDQDNFSGKSQDETGIGHKENVEVDGEHNLSQGDSNKSESDLMANGEDTVNAQNERNSDVVDVQVLESSAALTEALQEQSLLEGPDQKEPDVADSDSVATPTNTVENGNSMTPVTPPTDTAIPSDPELRGSQDSLMDDVTPRRKFILQSRLIRICSVTKLLTGMSCA